MRGDFGSKLIVNHPSLIDQPQKRNQKKAGDREERIRI
jgi:hypothetical protein